MLQPRNLEEMEHIPKHSDALPLYVHIPYLTPGELTYDGDFEDFPGRKGLVSCPSEAHG